MQARLLAPQYWPTWAALALLRVVALLPFAAMLRLGTLLGALLRRLPTRLVHIARRNIELCMPELSAAAREQLLAEHFRNVGIGLLEIPFAWWCPSARLARILRFEGTEHLEQARARGRGVILLTAHFTSLEISGRALTLLADRVGIMYRPPRNAALAYALQRFRANFGGLPIPRHNMRALVAELRRNECVWFAPDQSYRKKGAQMVPLFGIPAATNTFTPRLARMTGATVLPYFLHRLPGTLGYRAVIQPPLDGFPSDSPVADTARFNHLIEEQVRLVPAQYWWIHRRFKGLSQDYPDYYGRRAPQRA